MKVGIINVTGYAGSELARLLLRHPEVQITSVTGRSAAGQKLDAFFPQLRELNLTIGEELGEVDLAFAALPHKASAEAIIPLYNSGIRVIDISADFRLNDPRLYEEWYGFTHPAPALLEKAVYGLVELNRERVAMAKLVAAPGCYPTSAILALAPALHAGIIGVDIIVDSKSGVSGAGRTLSLTSHFSEVNENASAYSLQGHRHLPEIVQELEKQRQDRLDRPLRVSFVPHLIPMTRGILSTSYAPLTEGITGSDPRQKVREIYREFYGGERFVKVVDTPPQTKQTMGSNLCLIYPTVDERTGRLVVVSCIDNLIKGAAGQAIQCMNLMFGFPESMAIDAVPLVP